MKTFIISLVSIFFFVPCLSQGTKKKMVLPSYQLVNKKFIKHIGQISVQYNQKFNNAFIIYIKNESVVYVWMLDKKYVVYNSKIFGYTFVGNQLFFLQKGKDAGSIKNFAIPRKGAKRSFYFWDLEMPLMVDGVWEWIYSISGNEVRLMRFQAPG